MGCDIAKMVAGYFTSNRVFSFSELFWGFSWKKNLNFWNFLNIFKSYEIFEKNNFFPNSRYPVLSVFVINVSLFTSVVCVCNCQNGLRRKHGKCLLCNKGWHSFMNQRLIGSFIRWYGRPVDLPRVIEIARNEWKDITNVYYEWKIRRCSISTHTSTYFFRKKHLFSYTHTYVWLSLIDTSFTYQVLLCTTS
jgi:hypothetical protein